MLDQGRPKSVSVNRKCRAVILSNATWRMLQNQARISSSSSLFVQISCSVPYCLLLASLEARYAMVANVAPSSVVRPVVISGKLSKIDPQLLWNIIRKLTLLIMLPHSDPLLWDIQIFSIFAFSNAKYIKIIMWPPIRRRQAIALVNGARPLWQRRCCQLL